LKTYISKVEGLLMYSPAVFLHKDQKLMTSQDTVEMLQALTSGKLVLLEEDISQAVDVETTNGPASEVRTETSQTMDIFAEKLTENQQTLTEKAQETVKPAKRNQRNKSLSL